MLEDLDMTTLSPIDQITIDDYIQLYARDGAFEIINGKRKKIMPPVMIHIIIVRALFRLLDAFSTTYRLGEVMTEAPYVLAYNSNWVKGSRVPDVMFFSKERWQKYISNTDDWARKPAILIPDFIIEVVSPNDLYTELQQKVEVYQNDGVHLIWIVDPMRQKVAVYTLNNSQVLVLKIHLMAVLYSPTCKLASKICLQALMLKANNK
ncbi:MAG: Uma2 family endonuclease, partial [Anaerolineae bacterium]|nr:Uma2 family endonuclease [Anaerolineae bacterium]